MSEEPQFSTQEAWAAQRALRDALGLGPETFPLPAFVGMISDEVDQLRQSGKSDDDIARLVSDATGKQINGQQISDHYASAQDRHKAER